MQADLSVLMCIVAEFNCAKGVRKTSGVKCSTKELQGKGDEQYRTSLSPITTGNSSSLSIPFIKYQGRSAIVISDRNPNKRSQSFHCSANLRHNSALGMINRCLYDYRYVFRNKVRDSPSSLNRC